MCSFDLEQKKTKTRGEKGKEEHENNWLEKWVQCYLQSHIGRVRMSEEHSGENKTFLVEMAQRGESES